MKNKPDIKYFNDYSHDFVKSNHQDIKFPENYRFIYKNVFYRIAAGIVYGIACLFGMFYSKLVLHVKIENKEVLSQEDRTGFFLYGNHTQPVGDVFAPTQYVFPKRIYTIASTANLGIPVIGKILPMLGALIVPDSMEHMKEFMKGLKYHIEHKRCIVIYPEAHVWPYCSFIRPMPVTSFRFPVVYQVPAYCMTTTYQKRKFGNKPKITVYIDGPFLAVKGTNPKEEQKRLHDEIYKCMQKRSKCSTYEYIRYEKE